MLHKPHKLRTILVWLAVGIVLSGVCGALYSVYITVTERAAIDASAPSASPTPSPIVPSAGDLGHSFGIAAGGSLGELNDAQLDQRMAGIAASGARWVRFDFNWNTIQPDNSRDYNWDSYDKFVNAAQKYNLYILGILDFTPEWARAPQCKDSDKCHPADNRQFATFAKAVSHRYKARGLHYWEIWNEPNNPQFWQPGANPAEYTKLLKGTAAVLRAEDNNSHIITAGLSPQATTMDSYAPVDFLKGMYRAGAKGSFDAVADHPYTFPLSPKDSGEHAWYQMASTTSSMRKLMVDNGDGDKKIWITEYGSPTGGPGALSTIQNPNLEAQPYKVDEAKQAKILSDAIELYRSYDWVGPFMYYSYKDAGTTQDTNENFFGLVRANDSKKPAYQVFQDAAKGASVQAP